MGTSSAMLFARSASPPSQASLGATRDDSDPRV